MSTATTESVEVRTRVHPECQRQIHELKAHLSKERSRIVSTSDVLQMAIDLLHSTTTLPR